MVYKRFFLFIFLLFPFAAFSFFDDLFSYLGFDGEVAYEVAPEPAHVSPQAWAHEVTPSSVLQGYSPMIQLAGVKGTGKLPTLYHHKSRAAVPDKYNWQCGLHLLYNMAEIERILGLFNLPDDTFIAECQAVPDLFLENGSFPSDLKRVARRIAVSPFYIVEHNQSAKRIDIAYDSQTEQRFWQRINTHLAKPGVQCVHFGCLIWDAENIVDGQEECHIFLICVIKLENDSRALYLLDNMNRGVSRSAQQQMFRHAEYIQSHIFTDAVHAQDAVSNNGRKKQSGKNSNQRRSNKRR